MPYGLEFIPALASRFGSSAAGLTLRQAPRAVTSAAQSFNPVVQVPALLSRFGRATSGLTLRPPVPTVNPAVAGGLLNRGMTAAQFAGGGMLGAFGTALTLGGDTPQRTSWGAIPPTSRSGESYRDAELRLSAAARAAGGPSAGGGIGGGNAASSLADFRGGGDSSQSPAAERAYQQEVSRTAQLAAQNPELQRYEKAREAAAASGDQAQMDKVRDLGMEMWAKANPTLARKVKPGQSGYDAIQRTLGTGQMGSLLNMNFDTSNPLATGPATPTASYEGATGIQPPAGASALPSNAFAGASAEPYAGFMRGQTLTSAPLGYPEATPTASYEGATGIQPLGTNIPGFDPKSAEAQKFLAMFKNPTFAR